MYRQDIARGGRSPLRVRFLGGTDSQQAITREQARWWAEYANLSFEFEFRISSNFQGQYTAIHAMSYRNCLIR